MFSSSSCLIWIKTPAVDWSGSNPGLWSLPILLGSYITCSHNVFAYVGQCIAIQSNTVVFKGVTDSFCCAAPPCIPDRHSYSSSMATGPCSHSQVWQNSPAGSQVKLFSFSSLLALYYFCFWHKEGLKTRNLVCCCNSTTDSTAGIRPHNITSIYQDLI